MKKFLVTTALGLVMVIASATMALAANTGLNFSSTTPPTGDNPTYVYPNTYGIPDGSLNGTVTTDSTANDNGLINANQTGKNVGTNDGSARMDVIKNVAGQRTHGEYKNNTNSCASCHQTHTGAGETLLFKDGVYDTCTACHDGTLGFYNVFGNGTQASTAGTFGGTHNGNASVHLATGAMQIKSAPGGNPAADTEGKWTGDFNCASCHSPHGSYSSRLLAFNPNEMGRAPFQDGGHGIRPESTTSNIIELSSLTETSVGSKQYTVNGWDPLTETDKYIAVRGTAGDFAISGVATTSPTIVVYKFNYGDHGAPNFYTKNTDPWLYGYDYYATAKPMWTRFYSQNALNKMYDTTSSTFHAGEWYNTTTSKWQQDITGITGLVAGTDVFTEKEVTINYGKGYATGAALANVKGADIAQAFVVRLDMVPIANYGGVPIYTVNEAAINGGIVDTNGTAKTDTSITTKTANGKTTVPGMGVALNNFCAACHVDYLAQSGHKTGIFSKAYRHNTSTDSYTCVRCHYAHGTDAEVMKDASGRTKAQLIAQNAINPATGTTFDTASVNAYMLDKNPSSALKRYTNMAVCYGCHTSSHAESFINVPDYQNNTSKLSGLTDSKTPTELGATNQGNINASSTTNTINPSISQGYVR